MQVVIFSAALGFRGIFFFGSGTAIVEIGGLLVVVVLGTLLVTRFLAGAKRATPRRFVWVTGLKPEMEARYRELHSHPWPSVNKMIKRAHIQNFSIHRREIEGKLYLI